jgi:dipeptide transport system substrate-binding protein
MIDGLRDVGHLLAWAWLIIGLSAGTAAAKTLVYCSEGSPENFSPMLNTTGTSLNAIFPIYNHLVAFKLGGTEVEPSLAESWDIAAGGKAVTFHLRRGVKFQSNEDFTPTRDFNADDVVFTFERQWKESNPYHQVSGGQYSYFGDMDFPKLLVSIDKLDDYTVRFVLSEPQAPFIADMAMSFTSIMSKEYADTLLKAGKPEQIDQKPIGTGPFALLQYQRDSTIRYGAFKDYWGVKPQIDTLVFAINKDPAVRLAKLRSGECQVIAYPSLADLPAIRADPTLKLLEGPGLNVGFLAFNVGRKPFDDVRVRRAINMAIDRTAILDAVYQGAGHTAKNLIPPAMWSWNGAVPDFPYDPQAAKQLLAEAGLPDGFETDLWALPVSRAYIPDGKRIAELMQADLARIGVRAGIVTYDWGQYRRGVLNGDHTMALFGWTGDNGDPDNFFAPLASCAAARPGGGSATKWCNDRFDALIRKAATLPDQAERATLYEQAQVIMHDDAPYVLIAHAAVSVAMRANVVGYAISPFGLRDFSVVDLQ